MWSESMGRPQPDGTPASFNYLDGIRRGARSFRPTIRRENISASSDLLDKYKNAVETEYQLMAEEYEEQVREASQAGTNKSPEADHLRK